MACVEQQRRGFACRLAFLFGSIVDPEDFALKLTKCFGEEADLSFFGRQVCVTAAGEASYDVVLSLYVVGTVHTLAAMLASGDGFGRVELIRYWDGASSIDSFLKDEVGFVCDALSQTAGCWFGDLHAAYGVCRLGPKCVIAAQSVSSCLGDGGESFQTPVVSVGSLLQMNGVTYSERSVVAARNLLRHQVELDELELVTSVAKDSGFLLQSGEFDEVCVDPSAVLFSDSERSGDCQCGTGGFVDFVDWSACAAGD